MAGPWCNGQPLRTYRRPPDWAAIGRLSGGRTVLVVRPGNKSYATHRLPRSAAAVRQFERVRPHGGSDPCVVRITSASPAVKPARSEISGIMSAVVWSPSACWSGTDMRGRSVSEAALWRSQPWSS